MVRTRARFALMPEMEALPQHDDTGADGTKLRFGAPGVRTVLTLDLRSDRGGNRLVRMIRP